MKDPSDGEAEHPHPADPDNEASPPGDPGRIVQDPRLTVAPVVAPDPEVDEHDPEPEGDDAGMTGLRRDIFDAVRGRTRDYTRGNIRRAILVLAVPMVLEMFMQSVFAVADAWFVGQLDSDAALAVIGLTESMLSIVFAIGLGLSMGTAATIARRIGAKDPDAAGVTAVQAIGLGIVLSIVLGVIGATFATPLLRLMGASEDVVGVVGYTRHTLGGCGTILLLFLINAVFRGAGDAALAMRALWLANIVNIALDPIFIFGLGPIPAMGVTGAAVATNIGRGVGVIYQISLLARGKSSVTLGPAQVRLHLDAMIRLVRISGVGMFQFFVGTSSYLGLIRVLSGLGNDAAIAGYTIAVRIIIFALLPAWGVANAAATLVGQNLGAGQPDRAERSAWMTARYNVVVLGLVGATFILFARPLVLLFIEDPAVVDYGAEALRVISFGYAFFAFGMVMMMSLNGAGDTTSPTIVNLFCHWLLKIPLAYLLAYPFELGPLGVFLAIPIAESLASVVYIVLFRRGAWRRREV